MKYNFDEIVSRHHTNSYKWDSATLPDIFAYVGSGYGFSDSSSYYSCAAATCTARHFGYTRVPDEYYSAVVGWFSRRHRCR